LPLLEGIRFWTFNNIIILIFSLLLLVSVYR
jgi:hypothetical protein